MRAVLFTALALASARSLASEVVACSDPDGVIAIADERLEAAIGVVLELDGGDITCAAMATIRRIDANGAGVTRLVSALRDMRAPRSAQPRPQSGDLRNSKVPDLVAELRAFGARVDVVDPHADPDEAMHEYGLALADPSELAPAHAIVLAAPHRAFLGDAAAQVFGALAEGGPVIDVKARLARDPRVWAL